MQTVFYGGSYREEWKDNYHLTVVYENQKMLTLRFSNGAWHPADGRLPALPLAELYFRQAADAAVASRRFLASGLTAQDLTALAPSGGVWTQLGSVLLFFFPSNIPRVRSALFYPAGSHTLNDEDEIQL